MIERIAELEAVLREYERWEADVIEDAACWPWEAPIALTQERYDALLRLQGPRNRALRNFTR